MTGGRWAASPASDADDGGAALAYVLDTLHLAQVDENTFTGGSLPWRHKRVYGGQVLAQALLAAGATVPPGRSPHSMHAYFLRAGDPDEPITFAVERLRDGGSFSARRTHALQGGLPILSTICSFQLTQDGLEHAFPAPPAPPPEAVPSVVEALKQAPDERSQSFVRTAAFDIRHVEGSLFTDPERFASDSQSVWLRARGPVDDGAFAVPGADGRLGAPSAVLHAALLAYACDQIVLEPVLRRHGLGWLTPGVKVASLDHAMWWHRPARADEWLLYVQESPSARGGRGLGTARVYSRAGDLVASIAQEGMIRAAAPKDG